MDFSAVESQPGKKFGGLIIVTLFHVFIGYALVSGLARNVVEIIKAPTETKIIEEIKPPEDKTPPPPPPKLAAPPPPFVPPPEISVPQQAMSQNAISSVTRDAPPAAAPVAPVQRVDTGPVRIAAVVDSRACTKPEYPARSVRNEETGVVTLQFLIGLDGRVVESKVEASSGYRDLDSAARSALSLCKFKPGTVDGKPEQSWTKMQYVWKLE